MVISLERGADDLRMVHLMLMPLHYVLLHKNPEWFMFLVLVYPDPPRKESVKRVLLVAEQPGGNKCDTVNTQP